MSYMNCSAAFGGGIQELSFDEIDQVGGGTPAHLAAGALLLLCVVIGWKGAHNTAEQGEKE